MGMVDKGLPTIQISLDKKGAVLVMPPFANPNQKQFSSTQIDETYKIASVRIHVERIIQRMKMFNILNNRLSTESLPYIDDIVHLCAVITNLQPHIVKEK